MSLSFHFSFNKGVKNSRKNHIWNHHIYHRRIYNIPKGPKKRGNSINAEKERLKVLWAKKSFAERGVIIFFSRGRHRNFGSSLCTKMGMRRILLPKSSDSLLKRAFISHLFHFRSLIICRKSPTQSSLTSN